MLLALTAQIIPHLRAILTVTRSFISWDQVIIDPVKSYFEPFFLRKELECRGLNSQASDNDTRTSLMAAIQATRPVTVSYSEPKKPLRSLQYSLSTSSNRPISKTALLPSVQRPKSSTKLSYKPSFRIFGHCFHYSLLICRVVYFLYGKKPCSTLWTSFLMLQICQLLLFHQQFLPQSHLKISA